MSAWISRAMAFALVLTLAGCDLYETPERFVDETAGPPVITSLPLSDLKDGQAVAGTLRFLLRGLPVEGSVEYYSIYLNGVEYTQVHDAPYAFTLNTEFFPEGRNVLAVGVVLNDPNNGLLNLAEQLPSYIFEQEIVFDQSPPTPVTNRTAEWNEDGTVTVSWSRNTDANFYAYVVTRGKTSEMLRYDDDANSSLVDSIFDASVTSLRDDAIGPVYGAATSYHVTVSNRVLTTDDPDGAFIEYGDPLDDVDEDVAFGDDFFFGPERDRFYRLSGQQLFTYATTSGRRIHTFDLGPAIAKAGVSEVNSVRPMGLSRDGSEMFVAVSEFRDVQDVTRGFVIDVSGATPVFARSLDALPEDVYQPRVGPQGRLVGVVNNDDLHAFDAADGRDLGTIAANAPSADVSFGTNAGTFVTADLSYPGPVELRAYDLTSSGFPLVGSVDVPQLDDRGTMIVRPSADNQFLYVAQSDRNQLSVYDANTLALVSDGPLTVLGSGREIADLVEIEGRLYLTIYVRSFDEPRGRLVEVDPSTLDVLRTWSFVSSVKRLVPQSGGASVLVFAEYPTDYVFPRAWSIALR